MAGGWSRAPISLSMIGEFLEGMGDRDVSDLTMTCSCSRTPGSRNRSNGNLRLWGVQRRIL